MTNIDYPTADLIRAARGLLSMSQQDLAKKAGVAVSTIADFERGQRNPVPNNALAIKQALERCGLVFTDGGVSFGFVMTFKTETRSASLNVKFEAGAAQEVHELASIFGSAEKGKVTIDTIQCSTVDLKAAVTAYAEKYGKSNPHLYRLSKMLTDLRDGEFFLLLQTSQFSSAEELQLGQLLDQLNRPEKRSLDAEHQQLFSTLLNEYDLSIPRTDVRNDIGNPRKADRKCRFCGGTVRTGATFDKEAHALSSALGNQLLKLNDECDECNQFFGDDIEPSLIALLNVQRVFLGIKSGGAQPREKFSGGEMFHDGERMVISSSNISRDASGTLVAQLGKGKKITPQCVYRALAKYALSVIPQEHLIALKKTAEWVRYGKHSDAPLPKVAASIVALPPTPSAQIALYIRKSATSHLPHVVCEFRIGCYLYVYALPFSTHDNWDLIGYFDEDVFRNTFQHYSLVPTWNQEDFSGTREVSLGHTIRLEQRTKPTVS